MSQRKERLYHTDYKVYWESGDKPTWVIEIQHLDPEEKPYGRTIVRAVPNRPAMKHLNNLAEKDLHFVGQMLMAVNVSAAAQILKHHVIPSGKTQVSSEVLMKQKEGIRGTLIEIVSQREGPNVEEDQIVNLDDFLPRICDELLKNTKSSLSEAETKLSAQHNERLKQQGVENQARQDRRVEIFSLVAEIGQIYQKFSFRISHAWLPPRSVESVISAFVGKIGRSLEAMATLWQQGLDEDAAVIGRTMLEAVIDFRYFQIAAEQKHLDKLLSAWQLERIWQIEQMTKELPPDLAAALQDADEESEKKELLAQFSSDEIKTIKRHGYTGRSVFERARLVGLTKEYATIYRLTSRNVHARDLDEQLIIREVLSEDEWEAHRLTSIEQLARPILNLALSVAIRMDELVGTSYREVLDAAVGRVDECFGNESQ